MVHQNGREHSLMLLATPELLQLCQKLAETKLYLLIVECYCFHSNFVHLINVGLSPNLAEIWWTNCPSPKVNCLDFDGDAELGFLPLTDCSCLCQEDPTFRTSKLAAKRLYSHAIFCVNQSQKMNKCELQVLGWSFVICRIVENWQILALYSVSCVLAWKLFCCANNN